MPRFLKDETGAVTVDWVVLTAAGVGLGLAVMGLVQTGAASQSDDVDETLRGIGIMTSFTKIYSTNDFSDGRGDWSGGELINFEGFGDILALSGSSPTADLPLEVESQYSYAVVEFDMVFGDSWDGEQATISLNGQELAMGEFNWQSGEPTITTYDTETDTQITLTRSSTDTGSGRGRWQSQNDYTYSVQVVAANDGSALQLGASTTLNSGTNDEFFGIDNVQVSGAISKP
ncbi:hypothetical protein JANAI62_00150 [Jannaschia pagri]|uniref:DUF642 domain-containing protein n=1 Tax=Jannaschia pagri TaxID=2829797 RepID=A0ABQ4NG56_9RHOB|nr:MULTISPECIES: hypothetical protein [unclassified Jannaschia]GIT90503.1 hypothetical protein JANAI61_09610 [Jannaschia sp. AI_61]GIT93392.1 hypothetical protein JANAI62_00150 [Jannaschia sp. AI_62]